MTIAELKRLLDEYREKSYIGNKWSQYGFQNAVELLMPCLEALEKYKDKSNWSYWSNRDVGAFKEEWTMWKQNLRGPEIADRAIKDLEQKLKGEK